MRRFFLLVCCLWFLPGGWVNGESRLGGNVSPDGKEMHIDLPARFHLTNRGGSDGAGLCVFASGKHASIWQEVYQTMNIFEWMFDKPGGGWPEKFDKVVDDICRSRRWEKPRYIQYVGKDITVLRKACLSGRMPCVTYSYSPAGRYSGQKISHMVNLVHCDEKWVGVLDNNFPGVVEWIDAATFLRVWTGTGGNGWAIVFLNPGPPPPPRNR